ncbi:long chain fatty acid CoA ligase [Strigomonas culicis]|uniref:Long chain fatty acid CoA ligase n=1 Tax=Strigomonas culicis TaxID=28005 RepID=S9TUM9_9TRYP|nr:long chain fatty acid CoA ligase [Strigomonas culicis]|eukprot:EPY22092.1 long chain fatty acid CoA ligase [Strigomonas culicis]
MGQAVAMMMELQNSFTTVPNENVEQYKARLEKCGGSFIETLPGTEKEGMSSVFRLAGYPEEAHQQTNAAYHSANLLQRFRTLCAEHAERKSIRYRPIDRVCREPYLDTVTNKQKHMDITYLQPTVDVSLGEAWERVTHFGRGLRGLGVAPRANVAIFLDTCFEWLVTIYGLWAVDAVAATVYANLGHDALAYALKETGSAAVVCGGPNVVKIVQLMREGQIGAVPIIYVGALPSGADTAGAQVHSFAEVLALGRAAGSAEVALDGPANNDELALIMYTSGTTGEPKGVMHTHGSLMCGSAVLMHRIDDLLGTNQENDRYCSYLPMAHVMEFCVTNLLLARGATVGFGTPRTLTNTTARPHGDLVEYKPTLLVGVPRIFDTLKKAIEAKLPPRGSLKRTVFDRSFAARVKAIREGEETPFLNRKVFAPMRQIMGGEVRVMLSGGGPISAASQEFANVCFGQLVVGYGLTETVCVGGIQIKGDFEAGTTGITLPGCQYRLLDTEEYKHTDQPEPRGELLEYGGHIFKGYYKQPELTKEAIDADGWFHTGDVASLTADGRLRLIGRVKALAKNSLGEYIALENLEAIYGQNALLLPNGVCVLVHADKNYICAIGLTDEDRTVIFARENNLEGEYPAILRSPAFQQAATRSLAETAKAVNRQSFEVRPPRAHHQRRVGRPRTTS